MYFEFDGMRVHLSFARRVCKRDTILQDSRHPLHNT